MPRKVNFLAMQKVRVHGKATNQKKKSAEPGCKVLYGPPFKLFRFSDPVVELGIF